MKSVGVVGTVAIVLALAAPAGADVTVDPAAPDGCGSGKCRTIAQAAAAANPGDTIFITPATYSESPTFVDAGLTVTGTTEGIVTIVGTVRFTVSGRLKRVIVRAPPNSSAVRFDGASGDPAKTLTIESAILSGDGTSGPTITSTTQALAGAVTVNARHVTIADAGSAPALALSAAALTSITVNLENSIVLGTKPASGGGITVNESNDDNDGSVGHRTALFVDPANENFLLRVGSVAIDQGGGPSGGESTEDVEGQVRTGTWDRGADEFVNHQPAAPGLIADRVSATPGQQVNFAAIAGPQPDADRGDGVAKFRFDFGDGSGVVEQASGAASHTYAAAGQYAVTAKTVDIPGSASDPSNVVTITVAAAGGNGGGGPGGGGGGLPGGGSSGPDLAPPFLSITSPRAGQRLKRGKRAPVLRGRTSDATGVRTVELALRRLEGRRCRWYDTRRRTFVVGGCTTPRFFRAVVNDFGWSYTFPRNVLPPLGRYELRARATDFLGQRTTALTSAARTLVAFRIVP